MEGVVPIASFSIGRQEERVAAAAVSCPCSPVPSSAQTVSAGQVDHKYNIAYHVRVVLDSELALRLSHTSFSFCDTPGKVICLRRTRRRGVWGTRCRRGRWTWGSDSGCECRSSRRGRWALLHGSNLRCNLSPLLSDEIRSSLPHMWSAR